MENKDKNCCFVKTSDKETAELLMKSGFMLIQKTGEIYTFENCKKLLFNDSSITDKVVFSNILTF